MSKVICVAFCLVLLSYILMSDSCCCPIILLFSLMILFSGFLWMLDSAPNQEVMLKVIMDSMKHLSNSFENVLMDLEFAEFAKEKDGITICFEVELVVGCCPKASICVYPLYRLGPYGSLLLVILSW